MGLPPREEGHHPGRWQDPPLLPFSLFFRQERLCRWNPTPLNSLYERETFSLALSASPCSTPFYPLSSMKGTHPRTPPQMQRNLTHSLYNGRYSFIIWTHFPDGAIEGSGLSYFLSFFFFLSRLFFMSWSLYKGGIYSDSDDNMDSRAAQSARTKRE